MTGGRPSGEASGVPSVEHAEFVEAIAQRTAELLLEQLGAVSESEPSGLVDAKALARALGVTPGFVYAHAAELGGERLTDSPRPRLRFDVERARAALSRCGGEGSQRAEAPATTGREPSPITRRRRRLPAGLPESGSVLAVRGAA